MTVSVITSLHDLTNAISAYPAVACLFTQPDCGICAALKPKIEILLETHFPRIQFVTVDLVESRELAAQMRIFTVPTFIVYFGGTEVLRHSRNMSLEVLRQELARPYALFFEIADDSRT